MPFEPPVQRAKVCVVGERGVGKTALASRFLGRRPDPGPQGPDGAAIARREVEVRPTGFTSPARLEFDVWDPGGWGLRSLVEHGFFDDALGVVGVYDLTRRWTLETLDAWLVAAQLKRPGASLVVVGNKADLSDQMRVTEDDLAEAAGRHPGTYLLVSATSGVNVDLAFERLAESIVLQGLLSTASP